MREFIMLMKGSDGEPDDWSAYIESLMTSGKFRGGSALSNSVCRTKDGADRPGETTGFMRFEADSLSAVQALLRGNPVYEAGGNVEIAELIKS